VKTTGQQAFDKMHVSIVGSLLTAIEVALQFDEMGLVMKCRISMLP